MDSAWTVLLFLLRMKLLQWISIIRLPEKTCILPVQLLKFVRLLKTSSMLPTVLVVADAEAAAAVMVAEIQAAVTVLQAVLQAAVAAVVADAASQRTCLR
jgi:hypothetical protein